MDLPRASKGANTAHHNLKERCIFVTGGHATPAIACIDELRSRGYSNLMFIGQKKSLLFDKKDSAEYHLVTEELKLPFLAIITGKLSLYRNIEAVIWLLRFPVGFIQSLWWQLRYRPALILTFGSHIGIPPAFWGWVFGTPVVAHEQTVTLGRAQRIIQRFSKAICYSWEGAANGADPRFVLTGNPIRKVILKVATGNFDFADESKKTLLVTGGNQGAHSLNLALFANITELTKRYNIIHQTGSNSLNDDIGKARKIATEVNSNGRVYDPRPYLSGSEMSEAYERSTVALSRAGANTVTELLALRKTAVLIPIPTTSGNEQFLNGKLLEELGLAIVLPQTEIDSLLDTLTKAEKVTVRDSDRLEKISSLHKDAEKRVIDVVEQQLMS